MSWRKDSNCQQSAQAQLHNATPRRELQVLGSQNNSSRSWTTRLQEGNLNQNDLEAAYNQNNVADEALEQQNASDNNNLNADQPKEEALESRPCAHNINPATTEGNILHLKAIEALPSDQKLMFPLKLD